MYAQYAVSIKANRSSPRLLKNNGQRKMLLDREAFFYCRNYFSLWRDMIQ
nr:MAG TPA: hypothetical protein [Bacteriophage sp.]